MSIINTATIANPTYRSIFTLLTEEKNTIYKIPVIQREYAWESEQISDFYYDIINLMDKEKYDVYEDEETNIAIGQCIFYKDTENSYYIYDGQQRILTYILLCRATAQKLYKLYQENNDEEYKKKSTKLTQVYIIDKSEDDKESRIITKENNQKEYAYILGLSQTKTSYGKLTSAYKLIQKWIEELSDDNIKCLYHILVKRIKIMALIALNDNDAESLFYSTNSTGKPLGIGELLHARFHQLFKDDKILTSWRSIYDSIKALKKGALVDSYLLYSMQVDDFTITQGRLFSNINNKMKRNPKERKEFLNKIIYRLEILHNLFKENEDGDNLINTIINTASIRQIYPLYIALKENNDDNRYSSKKTIEILRYIVLQNNIIKQSPGTTKHQLQIILNNINKRETDIFKGVEKITKIYDRLIDLDVDYDNKTAKVLFILAIITQNKSLSSISISPTSTHLEHIVPQNHSKWVSEYPLWKKEIDQNQNRLIFSIGNYILLSQKLNQTISNGLWHVKKREIINSPFRGIFYSSFSDDLCEQDEITPEYIINRGKKISKKLVETLFMQFQQHN